MDNFFKRAFNLRGGETGLVILMSVLLLGNTVARQMSGIVGISDLINTGGVNQTLVVNFINGLLILATAFLSSLIVDRYNRIALLKWTSLVFALVFLILRVVVYFDAPPKVIAALVYLMSQQQWLVFPMFFWVMATDIFEVAQAKRLIPAIGSWSFIGKLIGIGLTLLPALLFRLGWSAGNELTLEAVTMINLGFYVGAFALITLGLRRVHIREISHTSQTLEETVTEGWSFVREVPSFSYLLLAVIAIGACDVILEFRFFVSAKTTISEPVLYKQFYSLYLLGAALASFAIQGFITSRVVERFQLKNTFLVQPLMALSTTLAMIASPGVISASLSSLILKISRNTVDEATRKAYQGFVPEERRGRVALFTDNYAPAIGMVLAAGVTGLVVFLGERLGFTGTFYIYLSISALAAGIAIWAILRLRAVYESSFMNWRLKRRRRAVDVLDKLDF